jgi:hypothetical protein
MGVDAAVAGAAVPAAAHVPRFDGSFVVPLPLPITRR